MASKKKRQRTKPDWAEGNPEKSTTMLMTTYHTLTSCTPGGGCDTSMVLIPAERYKIPSDFVFFESSERFE